MKATIIIIATLLSLTILVGRCVNTVTLKQDCTEYLKQAADANTVETANERLSKGIAYLEKNKLTEGYTSILYRTPNEDVGFWYNNLKSAQQELNKVNSSTSMLEKTNVLMKLRETLMENGENGDSPTYPSGLALYPNNVWWAIITTIALLWLVGLALYSGYLYTDQ